MKIEPINYLTVEVLTLLYPLFLLTKNIYPIVMLIIIIVHGYRLYSNYKYVNKDLNTNLLILGIYGLLIFGLFKTKQFLIFGILFGILQYLTYFYHEKQSVIKYNWFEYHIDIPIIIFSSFISYHGYKTKNIYLAPFLGDFVYHILEIVLEIVLKID